MGACILPMVLSYPASPLSHGQVLMDHGTYQMFTFCPMGHFVVPMVLPFPAPHVQWACSNGPCDISNVQPLSSGMLCVAHGPRFLGNTMCPMGM